MDGACTCVHAASQGGDKMQMKRPETEQGHLALIANLDHTLAQMKQDDPGYEKILNQYSRAQKWLAEFRERSKAKQERGTKRAKKDGRSDSSPSEGSL